MSEIISSKQNDKIKFIDKLKKSSHRKKFGVFIVEGLREITRAHQENFIIEVIYCPELFTDATIYNQFLETIKNIPTTQVTSEVFKKISLRENGDGLIALGTAKYKTLNDWKKHPNPLFLVTENIEKPNNFGAIIRTAESAGIDGIIVLDQSTEIFNPHVIRNSQGAVFFTPIFHATIEEFLKFADKNNITIFITTPHTEKLYFDEDFSQGSAILVGAESTGVSSFWLKQSHQIRIPQNGSSDSLNVSVATAVVLYECIRQRTVKHKV